MNSFNFLRLPSHFSANGWDREQTVLKYEIRLNEIYRNELNVRN